MSSQPVQTPAVEAEPAAATPAAPAADAPVEAPATETESPAEAAAPVEEPKPTPIQALYAAAKKHGHPEIWGVTLADPDTDVPSQIVFQKYLNANDGNLVKAEEQLVKTLTWRAETKPLELVKQQYSRDKFEGLGYVTTYYNGADASAYNPDEPEGKAVFTWNIYGSTKNIASTFGDRGEFINWRVALMEIALQDLSLATATKPITASYDPYKISQVHDYKSLSFLRQAPQVKTASQQTIVVFAQNYPELLKEKFFVNVPAIMGFVYSFMKVFVAAKTVMKFHPLSNGNNLAKELSRSSIANIGEKLPTEYGGKAGKLTAALGKEPELTAAVEAPVEAAAEAPEEAAAAPATETEAAEPAVEAAAPATAEPVKEVVAGSELTAAAKEEPKA